jgi:hypothetical protein
MLRTTYTSGRPRVHAGAEESELRAAIVEYEAWPSSGIAPATCARSSPNASARTGRTDSYGS